MTPRTASRIAWAIFALAGVSLLLGGTLGLLARQLTGQDMVFLVLLPLSQLAFGTVGALIASRQPGNALGWIFLGVTALWAATVLSGGITMYVAADDPAPGAFLETLDWLSGWLFLPALTMPITLLLLLFPSGSPPSPRWRWVLWISILGIVVNVAWAALAPGPMEDTAIIRTNPYALGSERFWDPIGRIGYVLIQLGILGSVAAVIVRFRRSSGEERQQIRVLAFAGVIAVLLFTAGLVGETSAADTDELTIGLFQALILVALTLVPVAAGIAILRYRLYDIEVVISKTVMIGVLVVFITAVYGAIVVGIGAAVGSSGNIVLSAVAAAVVAIAFQPVRGRARRFADRLVYGKRATPYEVLSEFSGRVGETYAADEVLPRMARILGEGTGAMGATIWLRVGSEMKAAAAWPHDGPAPAIVPEDAIDVIHRGETLGALSMTTALSDPIDPVRERLVRDLAAQAGLVLRNVRLVEELRESRRRIVAAQDDRAKQLERNIHDGAQQQLVALAVKQRLAASLVGRDDDRARAILDELQGQTTRALEDLRDLARGIYPPLLADRGLETALRAQAERAPIPVIVSADGTLRYPQEVEAAVYFSCLEAMQNVAKYADASRVELRLTNGAGLLSFEVIDDGRGFDPKTSSYGTGLQGMADRLAAIGGTLEVESRPGAGTTVRGSIPVEATP